MEYRRLIIRGISYSQTKSGAYALILEDKETSLKIPMVIGSFEAQSISLGLEKGLEITRPLTHDLFAQFIRATHFEPLSVMIYDMREGIFFSHINFINDQTGEDFLLDARTSDAVALAVRFGIPIYAKKQVIDEAGVLLEIENNTQQKTEEQDLDNLFSDLSKLSLKDLQSLLDTAVQNEDFDMALEIQEVLEKRKNISK